MGKVYVVGITDEGLKSLPEDSVSLVRSAGFIAGGERHLAFVKDLAAEKFPFKSNLGELAERLKGRLESDGSKPVVVLASGDPLFYGIGRFLTDKLGSGRLAFLPNLSSFQQAFARAGLSWEDAGLASVHGRPMTHLLDAARRFDKLAVFTDEKNDPAAVAEFLIGQRWPEEAEAWVAENLGGDKEKLTSGRLLELKQKTFAPLNVVICRRPARQDPAAEHAFGISDDGFFQRKPEQGLITKAEVRAVSLSKLRLHPAAVVWDIGAGSGSVGVECARVALKGKVWAVEKNAEDCENVRKNAIKYGTLNLSVVEGRAPEALEKIPDDPDSVFIGGSSGRMADILDLCLRRLRACGSLVVNTATVENTAEALAWFRDSGLEWGWLQMQVSRGKPVLDLNRLDALNPVFIFWGKKPA
jgi:precorrin-6Y C5,15-methyltransferase (decarboxylating)